MYKIKCLNKISPAGIEKFGEGYTVGTDVEDYDAIMVRSASMQTKWSCRKSCSPLHARVPV